MHLYTRYLDEVFERQRQNEDAWREANSPPLNPFGDDEDGW
ncbi:hypothetical protein [Allochromatium humboldtianum]|nr:hypothetical protein [Allochromatium humboldtianum]